MRSVNCVMASITVPFVAIMIVGLDSLSNFLDISIEMLGVYSPLPHTQGYGQGK